MIVEYFPLTPDECRAEWESVSKDTVVGKTSTSIDCPLARVANKRDGHAWYIEGLEAYYFKNPRSSTKQRFMYRRWQRNFWDWLDRGKPQSTAITAGEALEMLARVTAPLPR